MIDFFFPCHRIPYGAGNSSSTKDYSSWHTLPLKASRINSKSEGGTKWSPRFGDFNDFTAKWRIGRYIRTRTRDIQRAELCDRFGKRYVRSASMTLNAGALLACCMPPRPRRAALGPPQSGRPEDLTTGAPPNQAVGPSARRARRAA